CLGFARAARLARHRAYGLDLLRSVLADASRARTGRYHPFRDRTGDPVIEILSVTGPASVQDLGRFDQYRFGVGTSGAMDDVALRAGNILLANDENAAGIEIPMTPLTLRFGIDTAFALTGADVGADINGRAIPPWWRSQAHAGDVLSLKAMSRGARSSLTL